MTVKKCTKKRNARAVVVPCPQVSGYVFKKDTFSILKKNINSNKSNRRPLVAYLNRVRPSTCKCPYRACVMPEARTSLKDEWHHRIQKRKSLAEDWPKKPRIDYPASYSKLDYVQKPYSLRWNCSYFQASKTWSFTWPYFESDRFLETENHDHVILFHRVFPSQRKFLKGD